MDIKYFWILNTDFRHLDNLPNKLAIIKIHIFPKFLSGALLLISTVGPINNVNWRILIFLNNYIFYFKKIVFKMLLNTLDEIDQRYFKNK